MSEKLPDSTFEGPIEVRKADGSIFCSVGGELFQGDGPPRAWNLAGVPYETVMFAYRAPTIEEVQDFGYAAVRNAFIEWAEGILDEDFWSIEWRIRPTFEEGESPFEATILDAETGMPRKGMEMMYTASIRCRLIVHKRSTRPSACFANRPASRGNTGAFSGNGQPPNCVRR